jgi:hypothetical protein
MVQHLVFRVSYPGSRVHRLAGTAHPEDFGDSAVLVILEHVFVCNRRTFRVKSLGFRV